MKYTIAYSASSGAVLANFGSIEQSSVVVKEFDVDEGVAIDRIDLSEKDPKAVTRETAISEGIKAVALAKEIEATRKRAEEAEERARIAAKKADEAAVATAELTAIVAAVRPELFGIETESEEK